MILNTATKIRRKIACLVSLGLLAIVLQTSSYAATLAFDMALVETNVDQQFSLNIVATDFPSTFGGSILINFDPTIISVSNITLDPAWAGISIIPSDNSGMGTATLLLHAPTTDWPIGDFVFATVEFTALAQGNTELALSTYDQLPLATTGPHGLTPINFTSLNTNVTISAVPIPAAIWLLLSGIIGLFSIAHKKRATRATTATPLPLVPA